MTQNDGKNWAIQSGDKTYYVSGADAETAQMAENIFRHYYGLHFLNVSVRPTTPGEDANLETTEINNAKYKKVVEQFGSAKKRLA